MIHNNRLLLFCYFGHLKFEKKKLRKKTLTAKKSSNLVAQKICFRWFNDDHLVSNGLFGASDNDDRVQGIVRKKRHVVVLILNSLSFCTNLTGDVGISSVHEINVNH